MASRSRQVRVFAKTIMAVASLFDEHGIVISVYLDDHRDRVVLDTEAFYPVEFLKEDESWEVCAADEPDSPRIKTEIVFDPDPENTAMLFLKVLAAIFWQAAPMGSTDRASLMDFQVFLPAEQFLHQLSEKNEYPQGTLDMWGDAAQTLQVIAEGRDNYQVAIAARRPERY